ncbi:GYDIA family GHMP kinase [Croceimicrobium sp.]|uniref:GYDIA family GHMP kinase n=1 Tax=Croceimicrobium sp. TaxID=2828340 RepID=UPI003BADAB46
MKHFFAPGKLLLSAEYSVLEGAKAIAVPTIKGQHLEIFPQAEKTMLYKALDEKAEPWLDFQLGQAQSEEEMLVQNIILDACGSQVPEFCKVQSRLDFPRAWGLGSSSTFISLMAQWLETDVWSLFFKHLKGSGYDVAVAEAGHVIEYQLFDKKPHWQEVQIPEFFKNTFLLYLGKKQNSAREVDRYLKKDRSASLVQKISNLSDELLQLSDIAALANWMEVHEAYTAELIGRKPLPLQILPKYKGQAKSLGAWGGDFLWLSEAPEAEELKAAGLNQVFKFSELVPFTHS